MNLKQRLDHHYKVFDKSRLSPDPLQFPHRYDKPPDIEAMAIISAVFAYGNVNQIINTLEKIRLAADDEPHNFIIKFNSSSIKKLNGIKHRFYTNEDVVYFFRTLQDIYEKHNSLKNFFYKFYNSSDENLKNSITGFSSGFYRHLKSVSRQDQISPGLKFMLPLPELGSACKRTNLFLRWMVRKDQLDFGLWNDIPASKLIIPVDTHVARICMKLTLTKRKNVSWKMAEEITNNLKQFDANDPVKYDFAICHLGMRKIKF